MACIWAYCAKYRVTLNAYIVVTWYKSWTDLIWSLHQEPKKKKFSFDLICAVYLEYIETSNFVRSYPILPTLYVLSIIKAHKGYLPCNRVIWMNPATNITFLVITLETAGSWALKPGVGCEVSRHSAVKLGKSLCGNIPDTLEPEIYVIMAIPLKCMAVLFRSTPEGKYNTVNYQCLQRVSTIPQSTLDESSRRHKLFGYHTWDQGDSNP